MCQHQWLPREVLGMTLQEFHFAVEGTNAWNTARNPG